MATNKETGGPAFPVVYPDGSGVDRGMELRDYFAGQALPQAIAHEIALQGTQINPGGFRYADVARSAYVMADAMLKARST